MPSCNCCAESYKRRSPKQLRCDRCRVVSIVCKQCNETFISLYKRERTKMFCGRVCSGKWSASNRVNPPRSKKARKNMSLAQKRAYSEGRKISWNALPLHERQIRNKIHRTWGGLLHRIFNRGVKKEGHSHEQLGYSKQDLRLHLESFWEPGMSWENYGNRAHQWDIDHVKPLASFSLGTPASVVNALTNLRPLWALDNLKKGIN